MKWPWCGVEPVDCGMCLQLENRTWPAEAFAIFCLECGHETPALHVYGRSPLVRRGARQHWNRCLVCQALYRTLPEGAAQERERLRGLERAGQGRLAL